MKSALERLRTSSWVLAVLAELVRVVAVAGLFVLLARSLGAAEYGVYVAIFSIASLFVPIAAVGCGHVMIREISTGRAEVRNAFGLAVSVALLGAMVFFVPYFLLSSFIAPGIAPWIAITIGASELVLTGLGEILAQVAIAKRVLISVLQTRMCLALPRLGAVVVLTLLPISMQGIAIWVVLYAAASLPGLLVAFFLVSRRFGSPKLRFPRVAAIRSGIPFSLNLTASYVSDDFDKSLVLRYSGAETAGIYAAGYRVISLLIVPIRAVLNSTYSRFFELGNRDRSEARKYAVRICGLLLGYSAAAVMVTALFSPLLTVILGPSFEGSIEVVLYLLPLPALRAISLVFGDLVTGCGHQFTRAVILVVTSIGNVLACIVLIPIISWKGAVVSTLGTEAAAAISLVVFGLIVTRKNRASHAR